MRTVCIINGTRVLSAPMPDTHDYVGFRRGRVRVLVLRDSLTIAESRQVIGEALSNEDGLKGISYAS